MLTTGGLNECVNVYIFIQLEVAYTHPLTPCVVLERKRGGIRPTTRASRRVASRISHGGDRREQWNQAGTMPNNLEWHIDIELSAYVVVCSVLDSVLHIQHNRVE